MTAIDSHIKTHGLIGFPARVPPGHPHRRQHPAERRPQARPRHAYMPLDPPPQCSAYDLPPPHHDVGP